MRLRTVTSTPLALLFCLLATACSQSGRPSVPSAAQPDGAQRTAENRSATPQSCYKGGGGSTYTASATVTFYGWPDNSPPGNGIAHPVIHNVASGDGTYCNPTTFATEPTRTENKTIPYGTRIYVPVVQKYFIREDDCTKSGPQGLGCKGLWFDLWIGGDAKSKFSAVIKCENKLTPGKPVPVVINPPDGKPVGFAGPIYTDVPTPNGTCDGTG